MQISEIRVDGYEKVVRCKDPASGLHALIAVHDTTLGPALGGMRMLPYANEEEALFDVLRLSKGMTYKSAVADTGLGGGKSVILGDAKLKSPALFKAMGAFVDSLGGKYITAEDMNIGVADLECRPPQAPAFAPSPAPTPAPAPSTARREGRGLRARA
jgi:leucine dehydrogenase